MRKCGQMVLIICITSPEIDTREINCLFVFNDAQIIMKSLDPLRAKKIFIRKKLGHTAVSAIRASSVTLQTWQKEPVENTVTLQF